MAEHLQDCDQCAADYLDLSEAANLLTLIGEADLLDGNEPFWDGDADGEGRPASPSTG